MHKRRCDTILTGRVGSMTCSTFCFEGSFSDLRIRGQFGRDAYICNWVTLGQPGGVWWRHGMAWLRARHQKEHDQSQNEKPANEVRPKVFHVDSCLFFALLLSIQVQINLT